MAEVLICSDSKAVHDDVVAALADKETTFRHLSRGVDVLPSMEGGREPDLVVLDLQIGNMGGMATSMAIRLEEDSDRLAPTPIIMLLDRPADDFLARRARVDAWFVKPINPIALRNKATELLAAADEWWDAQDDAAVVGGIAEPAPADVVDPLDEVSMRDDLVVPDDHVVEVDLDEQT